jgi:hypothetical protein
MKKVLVFLISLAPLLLLAQDYTGTWTGNFTRDQKTARMVLELVDDGERIIGVFTLLSDDTNTTATKYLIGSNDRRENKFILRRLQHLSPEDKYAGGKTIRVIQNVKTSSHPTDQNPASQKQTQPATDVEYGFITTYKFVQFIASYSGKEQEKMEGNWYISEEGLNSYAKPAGAFSVIKTTSTISEETKAVILSIYKK